jgi:hypothetical protein
MTAWSLCDIPAMNELIQIACRHPLGSLKRQQALTSIIRQITPKLWHDSAPDYPDALQQTWEYFCKHLCDRYDETQASLSTWLNHYLRWRLHDLKVRNATDAQNQAKPKTTSEGDVLDPIDQIPATPDIPPILQRTRSWAEAEVELRRIHIRGREDATAQLLILRRLPPETSWKDLSDELGIGISVLSTFYQRQCLPRLRKFGESDGYL